MKKISLPRADYIVSSSLLWRACAAQLVADYHHPAAAEAADCATFPLPLPLHARAPVKKQWRLPILYFRFPAEVDLYKTDQMFVQVLSIVCIVLGTSLRFV